MSDPNCPLSELKRCRIPAITLQIKTEIDETVQRYYDCCKRVVKQAYEKAQHLLESELGLDKLSFQKPVGYTARFSELDRSQRYFFCWSY